MTKTEYESNRADEIYEEKVIYEADNKELRELIKLKKPNFEYIDELKDVEDYNKIVLHPLTRKEFSFLKYLCSTIKTHI